jgi:hypothetical protein
VVVQAVQQVVEKEKKDKFVVMVGVGVEIIQKLEEQREDAGCRTN